MFKRFSFIQVAILLGGFSFAMAGPESFVLQGQIIKPSGDALENSSVNFNVQIYSPGTNNCLLYEENFNSVNMNGSAGLFKLSVGTGTRSGSNFEDTSTLDGILKNSGSLTPTTCISGGPNYTPASTDERLVRLTFNDGSGAVTLAQNHVINSVPYAQYAKQINGIENTDILQVNLGSAQLTQANLENVFASPTDDDDLRDLIDGNSSNYLVSSPTTSVGFNNQRVTDVGLPTAANDATNKNYVDSNLGGETFNPGALGAGNAGEVLSWDGSKWVTTSTGNGDILDGGNSTGATVVLGSNDAQAFELETNDTTALTIDTSQGVSLAAGLGVTGGINAGDDISLLDGSEIHFQDDAGGEYMGFRAPSSVTTSTLFTLPDGDGVANQILSTDGSGQLVWATDSNSTDSVFGRTGAITAQPSDYDAIQVDNTAAGNIAATDVQSAIDELDNEKLALAGGTMSGNLVTGAAATIQLTESAGTGELITIAPNADASAPYTLTLPVDAGGANEILRTDGSGNLSWVADSNSVFTPAAGDYTASEVDNVAAGDIVATNVQAAIDELDSEKLPKAGGTLTGNINLDNHAEIQLSETDGGGADYVGFRAPADLTNGTVVWELPDGDGAANQILSTNGSGVLAWTTDTNSTASVFGRTGAIAAETSDYDAVQIDNTAAGDIAATNVQAAIDELDSEKLPKAGGVATGNINLDNNSEIQLSEADGNGADYLGFKAPADLLNGTQIWELPDGDGTTGQVLHTNGSGVLAWSTPTTGTGDFLADGSIPMTGNIQLNGNYLSGDGGNEGIFVNAAGNVGVGVSVGVSGALANSLTVNHDIPGSLTLPLLVQNSPDSGGSTFGTASGIGFRNQPRNTVLGSIKTAIVQTFRASWGRGDLHILQSNAAAPGSVTLSDSVLTVTRSGSVGIGTTAPVAKLHVNGSGAGNGVCVTSDGICGAIPAGGEISAEVVLNTGADYAEYFEAEEHLPEGDLVGLNVSTGKVRSYKPGDQLLGVVSTDPGVIGNSELRNTKKAVLVALVGQVPVLKERINEDNGVVFTKDGQAIGYRLGNGNIYLNLSSGNESLKRKVASQDSKIASQDSKIESQETKIKSLDQRLKQLEKLLRK